MKLLFYILYLHDINYIHKNNQVSKVCFKSFKSKIEKMLLETTYFVFRIKISQPWLFLKKPLNIFEINYYIIHR